jgi:hypothetical protein
MKLAEVVEGVQLERDLVRICLDGARGSLRPLLNLYEQIEISARAAGIDGSLSRARAVKLGLIIQPEKTATSEAAPPTLDGEMKVA